MDFCLQLSALTMSITDQYTSKPKVSWLRGRKVRVSLANSYFLYKTVNISYKINNLPFMAHLKKHFVISSISFLTFLKINNLFSYKGRRIVNSTCLSFIIQYIKSWSICTYHIVAIFYKNLIIHILPCHVHLLINATNWTENTLLIFCQFNCVGMMWQFNFAVSLTSKSKMFSE